MSDYTSIPIAEPLSAEQMDLVRRQAVRVWTDIEIATLSAPGKFLPGLADLMSRTPVWAEDEA